MPERNSYCCATLRVLRFCGINANGTGQRLSRKNAESSPTLCGNDRKGGKRCPSNPIYFSVLKNVLFVGMVRTTQVQDEPRAVLLRTRILPPYLLAIPRAIQSPSPLPFSAFVEKNGSNICSRCSGAMPGPSSAIRRRNSCRRSPFASLGFLSL